MREADCMGEELQAELVAVGRGSTAPQITIIVPTRNEAENVGPLLDRLAAALDAYAVEVLFVDDSTDDTVAVLHDLAGHCPLSVRVIARPPQARNGLSGAVVDGFRAAAGDWVCVMDADLQHPPETIPRLWEQAQRTGADIVVGSRRGDLFGPLGLSRIRSLNSKTLTILARMLFPRVLKNVSDPLTGLFLVRRTVVDVDSLHPDGFKILLEVLVRSPLLQVSEVHFDFAPRHGGESKADVREGGRFLRHLVRLRTTANAHLGRLAAVLVLGLLGNTALFVLLGAIIGIAPLWAGLVTAEVTWLLAFFAMEYWVFAERDHREARRRFWGNFVLTQITLLFVYTPVLLLLLGMNLPWPLLANLLALLGVALVRYLLSEQWVWTRGSIVWQPQSYFYNLHGILAIESQVPLPDLAYFAASFSPEDADIQIRVDRQGTPSELAGGISYDEHLGRFGFGLTVLPGEYTQIIVSPLLEHAPDFLFTNVVEPILRWLLVQRDYALIKAAGVAAGETSTLLHSEQDMAEVVSSLCRTFTYGFMGDDLVLLARDGTVLCYPKPVTISRDMLQGGARGSGMAERLAMRGQQLLYTRVLRRAGLWLSEQDVPAASLNTYLQRLIPQPKRQLVEVYPDIEIVERAQLGVVAYVPPSINAAADPATLVQLLALPIPAANFQPHPLLAERLRHWETVDLVAREREIISAALQAARPLPLDPQAEWWEALGLHNNAARIPTVDTSLDKADAHGVEPHGNPETL